MMHARLPYKDDDDFEPRAFEATGEVVTHTAVKAAHDALVRAEADHAQAIYWIRRATASNREARRKHLEAMTRAALEASVALRKAQALA